MPSYPLAAPGPLAGLAAACGSDPGIVCRTIYGLTGDVGTARWVDLVLAKRPGFSHWRHAADRQPVGVETLIRISVGAAGRVDRAPRRAPASGVRSAGRR